MKWGRRDLNPRPPESESGIIICPASSQTRLRPHFILSQHADILIVSKTPYADLANYWKAQGIDKYVQVIAGQEMGSKGHHIEIAKKAGKYEDDQVMMIGDGGGDLKAVKENNGLFYPTPPGQ